MKTLWIEASPKGDDALSSQLAQAYLEAADGVGEVERFSVWDDDVLRFGRDAAIAKFAQLFGESITEDQQAVWQVPERSSGYAASTGWWCPPHVELACAACAQGVDRHHRPTGGQLHPQ